MKPRRSSLLPPLLGGAVLLSGWTAASAASFAVPSPAATGRAIVAGWQDGWLPASIGQTLQSVAVAYVLAVGAGGLSAIAVGLSRYWYRAIDPLANAVYAVPKVVLLPVFMAMFGLGRWPQITLAAVSAYFPVYFTTVAGVRSIAAVHGKLARTLRASFVQRVVKFYAPAAAGDILVGSRIAVGLTLIMVTLGELFAGQTGLGSELIAALGRLDQPDIFAIGAVLFILGAVGSAIPEVVRRILRAEPQVGSAAIFDPESSMR